ncbi:phenylalanine--tRNA ligase subunit alpha [Rickettsiales endosymbiont of Stachyamoeba lipophora]|uniref:phenylalanine--tRNA ligase subunit alpha n=1 Tax=Rickettsiales endosymbiont of Stachyamoeba lipophora TaxID=2486578 RepID=UPI000F655F9E|nr:phenylalanine--tRNA ligase subunit alpha [Rickettsiales endosymbiont of Stachyamoeba lipophora]AZL15588.1 phenylalanine--tRNA ligase subunit alpha [Rickettsiales endosymbiont of Stachyamoeba lipophora]
MDDLNKLSESLIERIKKSSKLAELDQIKAEALGKNGFITLAMGNIKNIASEHKKEYGAQVNHYKNLISDNVEAHKLSLEEQELANKLNQEKVDITLPPKPHKIGSLHPISRTIEEIVNIFGYFGFKLVQGPEIDTDFNNFTALNIPETHPARQMHDTFYLKEEGLLLRTHTSNVQIRTMTNSKPPFRIISTGRTYRCDWDMTHTPMFHQIEGLCIDTNINMGHLKYLLNEFLKMFFEKDNIPMRLRPHYFPFTEPSAEVDISYSRNGNEFKIGEGDKWMEILGCGMVHPNVLESCGIDSTKYQGFAFGMGVERPAMLKYGISDLRTFFEGDQRWLDHYNFKGFDIPSLIGGLSA